MVFFLFLDVWFCICMRIVNKSKSNHFILLQTIKTSQVRRFDFLIEHILVTYIFEYQIITIVKEYKINQVNFIRKLFNMKKNMLSPKKKSESKFPSKISTFLHGFKTKTRNFRNGLISLIRRYGHCSFALFSIFTHFIMHACTRTLSFVKNFTVNMSTFTIKILERYYSCRTWKCVTWHSPLYCTVNSPECESHNFLWHFRW